MADDGGAEEDPFAAFGGDDGGEGGKSAGETAAAAAAKTADGGAEEEAVALFLVQRFLRADASLPLRRRRVLLLLVRGDSGGGGCGGADAADDATASPWRSALRARRIASSVVPVVAAAAAVDGTTTTIPNADGLTDDEEIGGGGGGGGTSPRHRHQFDACVLLPSSPELSAAGRFGSDGLLLPLLSKIRSLLVPAGCLLYSGRETVDDDGDDRVFDAVDWHRTPERIGGTTTWVARSLWPCGIQLDTCPWLVGSGRDPERELGRLSRACVALSSHERLSGRPTPSSIGRAAGSVRDHGYCVVRGLLWTERDRCLAHGRAVLDDLRSAAAVLSERDRVDLYRPSSSANEPQSYRELSMREDLRADVRYGPALDGLRGGGGAGAAGNAPVTVTAGDEELKGDFLRGNGAVLEIVRRVMNPVDERLAGGNWGRYNFDGDGPDGSYQDLRAGPVGGIVSLPGAADQALHADTPHLFENGLQLPPHYVNVFAPGYDCEAAAADGVVGQTALVHGSHSLAFVAQKGDDREALFEHLVRPRLDLGDALLFDCRLLHFGMANASTATERPVLYANMTMHWFHDPKNWDDERPIFPGR
jgi:hypothetical protein